MDTLGPTKCPDYQDVLIFQINLYDKAPFGVLYKCVDYAGDLIPYFQVSCMISRFHCT